MFTLIKGSLYEVKQFASLAVRRITIPAILITMLTACSGGGEETDQSAWDGTQPVADFSGMAVKGPLIDATVSVYAFDATRPRLIGELIAQGVTNEQAVIEGLSIPIDDTAEGPFVVEFSGGTELTTHAVPVIETLYTVATIDQLVGGERFYATPITSLIFELAVATASEASERFGVPISTAILMQAINSATALVEEVFGLGVFASTASVFYEAPVVTPTSDPAQVLYYRLVSENIAAIIAEIRETNTSLSGNDVLSALVADMGDENLDGLAGTEAVAAFANVTDYEALMNTDPLSRALPGWPGRTLNDLIALLAEEMQAFDVEIEINTLTIPALNYEIIPPPPPPTPPQTIVDIPYSGFATGTVGKDAMGNQVGIATGTATLDAMSGIKDGDGLIWEMSGTQNVITEPFPSVDTNALLDYDYVLDLEAGTFTQTLVACNENGGAIPTCPTRTVGVTDTYTLGSEPDLSTEFDAVFYDLNYDPESGTVTFATAIWLVDLSGPTVVNYTLEISADFEPEPEPEPEPVAVNYIGEGGGTVGEDAMGNQVGIATGTATLSGMSGVKGAGVDIWDMSGTQNVVTQPFPSADTNALLDYDYELDLEAGTFSQTLVACNENGGAIPTCPTRTVGVTDTYTLGTEPDLSAEFDAVFYDLDYDEVTGTVTFVTAIWLVDLSGPTVVTYTLTVDD